VSELWAVHEAELDEILARIRASVASEAASAQQPAVGEPPS
jgi:hypothetical protein